MTFSDSIYSILIYQKTVQTMQSPYIWNNVWNNIQNLMEDQPVAVASEKRDYITVIQIYWQIWRNK